MPDSLVTFLEPPQVDKEVIMQVDGQVVTSQPIVEVRKLPDGSYRIRTTSDNTYIGRYERPQQDTEALGEPAMQEPSSIQPSQKRWLEGSAETDYDFLADVREARNAERASSNANCLILLVFIIGVIIYGIYYCDNYSVTHREELGGSVPTPSSYSTPAPPHDPTDDLSLGDVKVYDRHITGTITNKGETEFRYVEVDFSLYDDSHAQVGVAMSNITHLDPYGTWRFDAWISEDNATNVEFLGIEATPE